MNIEEGIKGENEMTVSERDTAKYFGSGEVDVFATPALVALMENCAAVSIAPLLPAGSVSVGIAISTTHSKATPVGEKVCCHSEITRVDGRKITFYIRCCDSNGEIGEATHDRCIVDKVKFMEKVNQS